MRYRLMKNVYVARIEWEEGPGSLQNVVDDVSHRAVKEWTVGDGKPEKSVIRYAERFIPQRYDFDDPRIEESYTLERRDDDSSEWKFVETFLPKFAEEEEPFDDYQDSRE